MAKTAYSTTSAETKRVWEEKFFRDVVIESFFDKFSSESGDSIVHVKRALTKEKGDRVDFGIRYVPTSDGVGPGTNLEGNEDDVKTAMDSVTLTRRRYGVRDDGELSRQRVFFSIDVESEAQLKEWATEFIDKKKFEAMQSSPTLVFGNDGLVAASAAAAKTALTTTTLVTPAAIGKMRAYAKQTNAHARVPIRPITIKGRQYYVCLLHCDAAYDLKRNSEYLENLRECLDRSPDHPIFTGALGVSHDGVIFHEHERISIGTDAGAGSNVPYAINLFMGKQALMWAWGKDMLSIKRKMFDYDEEHGYAISLTYGTTKPSFTRPGGSAADFGSGVFYTARTQITDQ